MRWVAVENVDVRGVDWVLTVGEGALFFCFVFFFNLDSPFFCKNTFYSRS